MLYDASLLDTAGRLLIVGFFLVAGLCNLTRARIKDHIDRMAGFHTPFPAAALRLKQGGPEWFSRGDLNTDSGLNARPNRTPVTAVGISSPVVLKHPGVEPPSEPTMVVTWTASAPFSPMPASN